MIRARLRDPWVLAVGAVVVVAVAFYAWTAATSAPLFSGVPGDDPYNRLAEGFVHGHTYLPVDPDPGLLALPDPYDPVANREYVESTGLRDVSLYDGRFYAYWGASPAVVAFVPWHLLGLGNLSPGLAVLVFSIIALLCSVAVLRLIVRRWLPATPVWVQAIGVSLLAFGNMAPWLLRRPEVYEVAISGGQAFVWGGLLAVAVAVTRGRPRLGLLALGSLLLGLAFAARAPLGAAVVFAAAAGWILRRRGAADPRALAAAALGPFALCVALVAVYNAVRFGSPVDFGVTYELSGARADRYNSLSYVLPGLWYYVLCPLRPRIEFPFLWVNEPGSVPFSVPDTYTGTERTAGILPTFPMLALLFGLPWVLRGALRPLRLIAAGMVACGLVLMLFAAYFYWGAIQRYEMDFLALLLVPALVAWFALIARWRQVRRRRAVSVVGAILCVWGVVAVAAMSVIGSDDRLRQRHPGTYASLADFFSPVGTAQAQVAGHPVLGAVKGDPLAGPARYDRLGVQGAAVYVGLAPVKLSVVSPDNETATLTMRARRTRTTPAGARLILQERAPDGSVFSRPFREGTVAFPVALRRGRNTVELQLFADPPTGISDFPDAEDDGAIQALDLRLG